MDIFHLNLETFCITESSVSQGWCIIVNVFEVNTFLDAITSSCSYPCQSVSEGRSQKKFTGLFGNFSQQEGIVAKKWEPRNLVPSRFSGEIRKVEARLGKLAKIRKVETD